MPIRRQNLSSNRLRKIAAENDARALRIANEPPKNYRVKVRVLTLQQHKTIALLSDFMNCWTTSYICGQVGISLATLKEWRNDPFFLLELDKEITRRRTTFRLEAHRQLFKQIRRGRPRMLLSYLKMTGDFTEKLEVTNKEAPDVDESKLDEEIERLQDELGTLSKD